METEDIEHKQDWQLEGTYLNTLLEEKIKKLEVDLKLNESKYIDDSIQDKFFKLL